LQPDAQDACTCARLSGDSGSYPCPVHPEFGAATIGGPSAAASPSWREVVKAKNDMLWSQLKIIRAQKAEIKQLRVVADAARHLIDRYESGDYTADDVTAAEERLKESVDALG